MENRIRVQAGQLIYSKDQLPPDQFGEGSRAFLVKDQDPKSGEITVWALSSRAENRDKEGSVYVRKNGENGLKYSTSVMTQTEYHFPDTWNFKIMDGSIPPKTMDEIKTVQEHYLANNTVTPVSVSQTAMTSLEQLRERTKEIMEEYKSNPEMYTELLKFSSNFYRYSLNNVMLIISQNPNASLVGSETFFRKKGLQIKPEERTKGIQILRPEVTEFFLRNEEPVKVRDATREEAAAIQNGEIEIHRRTTFLPALVYDVQQTNVLETEHPRLFDMGYESLPHKEMVQMLTRLCEESGIPVEYEKMRSLTMRGYYNSMENRIALNERLQDSDAVKTLAHEYAHALLHRTSTQPPAVKEFEAESVAMMIVERFGLETNFTTQYSKEYIGQYLEAAVKTEGFDMEASLSRINRQFHFIGEKLEKYMEEHKEQTIELQRQKTKEQAKEINQSFVMEMTR